jgi:hypothetical protein
LFDRLETEFTVVAIEDPPPLMMSPRKPNVANKQKIAAKRIARDRRVSDERKRR